MTGRFSIRRMIAVCLVGTVLMFILHEGVRKENTITLWRGGEGKYLLPSPPFFFMKADPATGIHLRLDSIAMDKFHPEYELQVIEKDTGVQGQAHGDMIPVGKRIAHYNLEKMKIRKAGKSHFHFRVVDFYPDFGFTYTYPANTDTIPPSSPGISIELSVPSGKQMVTLLENKPEQRRLDDVVGLGAALEFSWLPPSDSVLAKKATDSTGLTILFTGKDRKMYVLGNGKNENQVFELNRFNTIPGHAETGFTILQSYPDAQYLKAEPTTRSDSLRNPVARVEIWPKGGRSNEVYLYPESVSRHGGSFSFEGTRYALVLKLRHQQEVKAGRAYLSYQQGDDQSWKPFLIKGESGVTLAGHQLCMKECDSLSKAFVKLGISDFPYAPMARIGSWIIGFMVISIILLFLLPVRRKP